MKLLCTWGLVIWLCAMGLVTPVQAGFDSLDPKLHSITLEEVKMIQYVVMHEVGYCSEESQIAVTNVILNRLQDGRFGTTITEILHAPDQFGAIHNYYDHEFEPTPELCKLVNTTIMRYTAYSNRAKALYYYSEVYCRDAAIIGWFHSLYQIDSIDGQLYFTDLE